MRDAEYLVKTKQRVASHGEVFTPTWMVEDMLDLVDDESARIESRVLEPACGSGNFLVSVLARKLATVQSRHAKSAFERCHYSLLALMCLYGIELLADNAQECRDNLTEYFSAHLGIERDDTCAQAARVIVTANIVEGHALDMTDSSRGAITFPEWGYIGKGKFQRRDFRYDSMTQRTQYEDKNTLFGETRGDDLFTPVRTYPVMTIRQIAEQERES